MTFKDILIKKKNPENVEEINEASVETRIQQVNDMFERLEKILDPTSGLCKEVSKELGSGFKKDFQKMHNKLIDAWGELEEIEAQWGMSKGNN